MRLLRRVLLAGSTATVAATTAAVSLFRTRCANDERLQMELARLRRQQAEMVERWANDDFEAWRKLPARAWPADQPPAEEVPALRSVATRCCASGNSQRCHLARFRLATALVYAGVDPREGLEIYMSLAEDGNSDGMVACGICLIDGFDGVDESMAEIEHRERAGCTWLRKASERGNAQGLYELGVCHYNGTAVEMDEVRAAELFKLAAEQDHTHGLFMYGDCLLEGVGCAQDGGLALQYIQAAADRGHRGARSRLMALLTDNGQVADGLFTDRSRQSLIDG
jgi:TPR repeat protein